MSGAGAVIDSVRAAVRRLEAYSVPHPPAIRAKLDANELPYSLPPEAARELGAVLADVALNRYPAADCGRLREILAAEMGVPPATLVFGNGSDELIAMILSAFSEPPAGRDRAAALYPGPTFGVYGIASAWCGVEPVEVPLGPEFELDEAALERAVADARPNVSFFARPNNPTGTLWPREPVLRLAEANPATLVVHDEAYGAYGGDSVVDQVARLPNLVVMRTLSKVGMAGLRIGYLHAHPDVVHELEKVRPPYNVSALSQAAAVWILDNHRDGLREHCMTIAAARDRMLAALGAIVGVHAFDSKANLILLRIGEPGSGRAPAVWQALCDRGVLVRKPGSAGPLADCLRVTVGTEEENMLFLTALHEVLA